MKKGYIFSFIFGLMVATTVTVVASNLNASEIDYKNTKVSDALDTLYQRSTYTEYNGTTTITPSTEIQTLNTNNKLLKNNLTINAIPSTYKNLSTVTDFTASDLIYGKTAYNSNGELITGSIIGGNCVYGTITCTDTAGDLIKIVDFNPSVLDLYWDNTSYATNIVINFNRSSSNTQGYRSFYNKTTSSWTHGTYIITDNFDYNSTTGAFSFKNWQLTRGATGYYIACR